MEEQNRIYLKKELYSRYGAVRRAFDYHLYTAKGVRLLDLCQEGGAAILGWRSGKSKLAFKNLLDRGMSGTFPTEVEGELVRAVQEVLPQYREIRWYASRDRARLACASYLGLWSDIPLIEFPLLHPEASVDIGPSGDSPLSAAKSISGIPVWRPWLDEAYYGMGDRLDAAFMRNTIETEETMILSSPLPFAGGCTLAAFSADDAAISGRPAADSRIPESDSIAPALLGALARAWADLAAELPARDETSWGRFDEFLSTYWDRRGPYLVPKIRKSRYPEFFRSCLDKGIMISPDYETPSIVPHVADAGEFKRLKTESAK